MSEKQAVRITFWGVRGSHPVPGGDTVEFGGNTPCVEVRAHGHTIILDAGTGIIGLGRALLTESRQTGVPIAATVLFSHFHHDHTQGFPFFAPAHVPSARLNLLGPKGLESVLVQNQRAPLFPVTLQDMGAHKAIQAVQEGRVIVLDEEGARVVQPSGALPEDAVIIRVQRSYAHPGGTLLYRIEAGGQSVVYATDTEGYIGTDKRLVAFTQGADVLIHDAQYTEEHYCGQRPGAPATQGYGHSTAFMACAVAAAAGVGRLVLFHHDPSYDDATIRQTERRAQALFPNVAAAQEGLEIVLEPGSVERVVVQ